MTPRRHSVRQTEMTFTVGSYWVLGKDCGASLDGVAEDLLGQLKEVRDSSFAVLSDIRSVQHEQEDERGGGSPGHLEGQRLLVGAGGRSWKAALVLKPDVTWDEIVQTSKVLFVGQKGAELQTSFKKLHQACVGGLSV